MEVKAKSVAELIDIFTNKMPSLNNSRDTIGQIYEYFLQKFALESGRKSGEFYTPACVVKLLVALLKPEKGRVYDPCCGTGGMFIQSKYDLGDRAENTFLDDLHSDIKVDYVLWIAGIILANGSVSAGNQEETIRQEILKNNLVEGIIQLPNKLFYTTQISAVI
ncbi:6479_t:CDS:2 [Funneliformis geosporum]|nr:6479_t:CDS:2 [Funneliformis geosporum]